MVNAMPTGPQRITHTTLVVLSILLYQGTSYGADVIRRTQRKSGTVYQLLWRLESYGWVTSRREAFNPQPTLPPRRLYRLTPTGAAEALELLGARAPHLVPPEYRRDHAA